MKNRFPAAFVAMLVILAAGGCSCEDTAARTSAPRGVAEPMAISVDPVCNEGSGTARFTLTNTGTGTLSGTIEVVGSSGSEAYFDVDPKKVSLNGTGASQEIVVTFHPTGDASGRQVADVRVTYEGADGTQTLTIVVDGEVNDSEVAPHISFACALDANGNALPACRENSSVPCCSTGEAQAGAAATFESLGMGAINVGETSVLPLRIENRGCGTLTVDSLALEQSTLGDSCDPATLVLDGADAPFDIVPGLQAGEGHEFTVSFTPDSECNVNANLLIASNAPNHPTRVPSILGRGKTPGLTVTDTRLFFGEILPGNTDEKTFALRNIGEVPVTINEVRLSNKLDNTLDFSIVSFEKEACEIVDGNKVPSGTRTAVSMDGGYTVAGREMPVGCGDDEVFVTVRYAPSEPADQDEALIEILSSEGTLSVTLGGGAQAGIDVVGIPGDGMLFRAPNSLGCNDTSACGGYADACLGACEIDSHCDQGKSCVDGVCEGAAACVLTCGTNTRSVDVCNIGVAPLRISAVGFESASGGAAPVDPVTGDSIFRVANDNCVGSPVAAGACCQVEIAFKDKNTGGPSSAFLVVESNAHEQEKTREFVQAETPTDDPPQANWTVSPDTPKVGEWITINASTSADPGGGPISAYRWEVVHPNPEGFYPIPAGPFDPENLPDCGPTVNGGNGCIKFPNPQNHRIFEFYASHAMTYTFRLEVDDEGCDPPKTGTLTRGVRVTN